MIIVLSAPVGVAANRFAILRSSFLPLSPAKGKFRLESYHPHEDSLMTTDRDHPLCARC